MENNELIVKWVMHKKQIKTQKELLGFIYDTGAMTTGRKKPSEWVKSVESNFSSMKKGERPFPFEYKYALSELSGLSFSELCKVSVTQEEKIDEKEFKASFGIRWAAYKDDKKLYKRLLESIDGLKPEKECGNRWIDGAEYGKYFIDYVLEYKAVNGLKFLLDLDENIYSDWPGGLSKELLSFAIEIDEVEVFKKLSDKLFIGRYSESIYDEILKSKNIIKVFTTPTKANNEYVGGRFPDEFAGLFFRAIELAIESGEGETVDNLFGIYEKHLRDQIKAFVERNGYIEQKDVRPKKEGGYYLFRGKEDSAGVIIIDFDRPGIYEDFSKYLSERYKERFDAVSYNEVQNAITGGANAVPDGGQYVDYVERKVYRKRKPCLGYEMMKLMTYDNDVSCVSRFYGDESTNGLLVSEYECSLYNRDDSPNSLHEIVFALNEIHRISEGKLGKGRVYSCEEFKKLRRFTRRERISTYVFGGWIDNTRICSPEQSLTDALLFYIDKLGYDRESNKLMSEIKEEFSIYYDKSHLNNLGDRLLAEIDERISAINKKTNVAEYEKQMHTKTFVETFIDEINALAS